METKSQVDVKKAIGHNFTPCTTVVSNNDAILYALSIGFSEDQLNKEHFRFTYENDENFSTFPTIPVIFAHRTGIEITQVPGLPSFNPMMLLHGEENLEIIKPLPPNTKINVQEKLVDLADKGKITIATVEAIIKNAETGEVYAKILSALVLRGIGGYGHKGTISVKYPVIPKRKPDFVVEEKTQPNQALLYRLNSDLNPLHVDPDMAAMGGFDKPIIHGLCSYGFTARAVYEKYAQGNPNAIHKFSARFTSHVFPGETYLVELWKEGNYVMFETKTKERGLVAVRGFAELRDSAKL